MFFYYYRTSLLLAAPFGEKCTVSIKQWRSYAPSPVAMLLTAVQSWPPRPRTHLCPPISPRCCCCCCPTQLCLFQLAPIAHIPMVGFDVSPFILTLWNPLLAPRGSFQHEICLSPSFLSCLACPDLLLLRTTLFTVPWL